ncbi:DNA-packaging protein gp3 [Chryseobacterium oranimense]|uniref:DNA-packaging protein gp3 n=1 Tax=Chryseobacterium oranimense TaxID=421058 RepID=A0A1M5X8L0_9FLAO|nr:terminase small subunit [Chryseobacterium oranimense]SHH96121.1 DNA-packaging protein gp3 [Chryseobacterium oranimense]
MKTDNNDKGRDPNGKFAEGNKFSPGRTPIYSDPEHMATKLLDYFTWIEGEYVIERKITTKTTGKGKEAVTTTEDEPVKIWTRYPEPPTMTGLAIYLGFASRQSLYDYAKEDGFSYPIKRALLEVENNYEKGLFGDKVIGVLFALKNMGWTDRTETDITSKGDKINASPSVVTVEIVKPDFED